MGATLNIAAGKSNTITDRATWISFKNKSDLKIFLMRTLSYSPVWNNSCKPNVVQM